MISVLHGIPVSNRQVIQKFNVINTGLAAWNVQVGLYNAVLIYHGCGRLVARKRLEMKEQGNYRGKNISLGKGDNCFFNAFSGTL